MRGRDDSDSVSEPEESSSQESATRDLCVFLEEALGWFWVEMESLLREDSSSIEHQQRIWKLRIGTEGRRVSREGKQAYEDTNLFLKLTLCRMLGAFNVARGKVEVRRTVS